MSRHLGVEQGERWVSTLATVGPGEVATLFIIALWPALSWWAIRDIRAHRAELARAGHPAPVWYVVVIVPLVGPYLYARVARRRITLGP